MATPKTTLRQTSLGMKITTIGRGNVGGGLAKLWQDAGHDVNELGREGGDATGSDAALLAVPTAAIGDALFSVKGLDGVPVIDATNVQTAARAPWIALAREFHVVPVAVVFGVGTPEQAGAVGEIADGVIIGSRLVRAVAEAPNLEAGLQDVRAFLSDTVRALGPKS